MRAISKGRGGRITSGAFPDSWLQRLADLARSWGREGEADGTPAIDRARKRRMLPSKPSEDRLANGSSDPFILVC